MPNYIKYNIKYDSFDTLDVPTEKQLESPEFIAVEELMRDWDISINGESFKQTNANHVATIINVINKNRND